MAAAAYERPHAADYGWARGKQDDNDLGPAATLTPSRSSSSLGSSQEFMRLLGKMEHPECNADILEDPDDTPLTCSGFPRYDRRTPVTNLLRGVADWCRDLSWLPGIQWRCVVLVLVPFLALVAIVAFVYYVTVETPRMADMRFSERDVCNPALPYPQPPSVRTWIVEPLWRRLCEQKNRGNKPSWGRNWCWVGVKRQCHNGLKLHHSWEVLQLMASEQGTAPGPRDEPFHPLEDPEVCDNPAFGKSTPGTANERLLAKQWFEHHVAVYVLNLASDTERWKMISRRLDALQIFPTRVEAVDMRLPNALGAAKSAGWVPGAFNFTRAQHAAYDQRQEMGSILGTIGCAAAHFKVQAQVLAGQSPLAVVFEDDSWPFDDFVVRLWRLVREELPCDWQVVALLSRCPYGKCVSRHLARVQPDTNEPAWRCHHGVNWGMHAMMYRTQSLADLQVPWKRAVFDEERPHCMDVDVALASISDTIAYYAVPAAQDPGLLWETNHESTRWNINQESAKA